MPDRVSEHASAFAQPLPETRVWASEVLAPYERQPESELTRALRQAYLEASTTNASGLGRFLSVDPIISKGAMRRPQMWNRYAYVANNPINATDPTGKLLQMHASPCSTGEKDCYTRLDAFQATKDMLPTGAGKYLSMDKNGFVTLKGISQAAFAKQFGGTAGRLAQLMSTTRGTAHVSLSSEKMVDRAGGAGTNVDGPNAIVKVDPGATPNIVGGVAQTVSTALAHELGHAYQHIFGLKPEGPGIGYIDPMAKLLGVRGSEAFGVWAENQYRQEMGLEQRTYYMFPWGDYIP
jgi:RHS repeat-associated protein